MMPLTHRFIWPTLVGSFALLIIGLALPQTSDAAIYKWKDDNGKLHFTDQPSKIPLKYRKKHNKPIYKSIPSETQGSSTGSAPINDDGPGEFSAFDSLGRRISITVNDNTALFAMATWCPYSKKLARFLSDPSVSRKMQHLNLIFVFEDEWPHIKKQLDKSVRKGGLTQRQADEQLERYKKRAKGKIIYNPDFTRGLPGKHYFVTHAATKLKKIFPNSIPKAYSPSQEDFNQGVTKWLRTQFQDEETTQDFLVAEFKKYNNGEK